MSRLHRLRTLGGLRGRALSGAVAASDLLSQIQTPTLAWGDIKTGATPWYSDAGTTPAVPTNGVYRLTEHIAGAQYAEQSTAGSRPTLTDGTPYDYLLCDGGDRLTTPSNIGKTGDFQLEIVVVGSFGGDNEGLVSFGGSSTGGAFAITRILGRLNVSYRAANHAFQAIDTSPHVIRVVKTPGLTNSTTRVFVDGVETAISSGPDITPALEDSPVSFGCIHWPTGASPATIFFSTGRMYCCLYYSSPLASDALRAADDAAIADWLGL